MARDKRPSPVSIPADDIRPNTDFHRHSVQDNGEGATLFRQDYRCPGHLVGERLSAGMFQERQVQVRRSQKYESFVFPLQQY